MPGEILFYLYLIWAAWQDCRRKCVLRGTHLLGLGAVLLRNLMLRTGFGREEALVLFWCLLSERIYRKFEFYGLADSLVFLNCFLYYWGVEEAFVCFFLFWWMKVCSGLLLLLAQILRGKGLRARLKEPAAYIPWILGAFALTNAVLWGYNV